MPRRTLRRYVPDIDSYKVHLESTTSSSSATGRSAVENYNECYHCRFVHPAFTKGVIAADSVNIWPQDYTLSVTGPMPWRPRRGAIVSMTTSYNVIFLWPSMSIQVYPGRVVNTYWWAPTAIDETRVYRGWLSPGR